MLGVLHAVFPVDAAGAQEAGQHPTPKRRSRHPPFVMGKARGATPAVHSLKESPCRHPFWNGGSLSVASSNARARWCVRDLEGFQSVYVGANVGDGRDGQGAHQQDNGVLGGGEHLQVGPAGSL